MVLILQNPEGEGGHDHLPLESALIFKVVACMLFVPAKLGLKHAGQFTPVPLQFLAFLCAIVSCFVHIHETPH